MKKNRVAMALLPWLLFPSISHSAIVLSSYDTGTSVLRSYYEIQAFSRSAADIKTAEFSALPIVTTETAEIPDVRVTDAYDWQSDRLRVSFVEHRKTDGSFITSHGAMIFSVDEARAYSLSGRYDVSNSDIQEVLFSAIWQDLTEDRVLYESIQADASQGGEYLLGGLTGNRRKVLSGNSENTLLPGHVYRVMWTSSIDNFAPNASQVHADGYIVLNTVPEPGTLALSLLAILAPLCRTSRKKLPQAAPK